MIKEKEPYNLERFPKEEPKEELPESKKEEKGEIYYFSPADEFDTDKYLEFLKDRDSEIEKGAIENLSSIRLKTQEEYLKALEREKYRLKYFPVIFVSVPHIESGVSGTFPGEPTPLMYATSVLDKYIRTDTFPAKKSPDVLSMMNPTEYSDEFIQNFIKEVKLNKPRVVGISNTSEGHYFALEIAKIVKQYSPETIVILGGSHEDGTNYEAYLKPEVIDKYSLTEKQKEILKKQLTLSDEKIKELIDILVAGDGQYALVEIFKFIANNSDKSNEEIISEIIKNKKIFEQVEGSGNIFVNNREKNQIESISLSGIPLDWNKLPFMFRGRLTTENRFPVFGGKKTTQVMSQMGCKYACDFCIESTSGDIYRKGKPRSIENVVQEIEILIKDYGYEAIFFDDSTFTQSPERTEMLLDRIIEVSEKGVSFEWGCQTTFIDIPSKELIEKMRKAGCSYIYFGFEQIEEQASGKPKKVELNKVEEVLKWCKETGIKAGISLQFGLEGIGQYKETIDYVNDLYRQKLMIAENSVGININTPYPGTREWLRMIDEGKIIDFSQKLERHPRFESAHQLSNLTMPKVNEIYAYARQKLGKGLIGVKYDSEEIQKHLEQYKQEFPNDFYFNNDYYKEYLEGKREALHLNHASISNKPREIEILSAAAEKIAGTEKESFFEKARAKAAELIGVSKEGVVFGRNTTEVTKLISWLAGLKEGDRVLLTNAENKSIVRLFEVNMDHGNPEGKDVWSAYPTFYRRRGKKYGQTIEEFTGVKTDVIDIINKNLKNIYKNIEQNMTPETRCFVISHVIRDTGVELPVREICNFVREKKKEINPSDPNIFIIIDGAQALGNLPKIKFDKLGCDAYVATPHKTMGSTPVGLGFFNPENPKIKKNLPRMNKLYWQDEQVILDHMFSESLGIKANVNDEVDFTDTLGLYKAIQNLEQQGYKDGNFEKISKQRGELKEYFRDKIHDMVKETDLRIYEVKRGTNFIYSFSVAGINNKEFVEKLAKKGIFISYIDRAKIQKKGEQKEGNGVIRASFDISNSKKEIDNYVSLIKETLVEVKEKEFAKFEERVDREVIFHKPENVLNVFEWLRAKAKSPITKIAAAAAVALAIVIGSDLFKKEYINIDQTFLKAKIAELDRYKKIYDDYRRLLEKDGFQHRAMEEKGMAEYYIEKYKFLTSLGDKKKINKLLRDDISIQAMASSDFSEAEKKQIEDVYRQTKNKKLGRLLELIKV